MDRLDFLPSLDDDETVYSWCAKTHLVLGLSAKATGTLLFGSPHACRVLDVPRALDHFSAATGGLLGPVEELLKRTSLAAFLPFASPAKRTEIVEALARGAGTFAQVRLGIPASKFSMPRGLSFCAECAEADLRRDGVAAWKVDSQLPGAWVCAAHGRPLIHVAPKCADWIRPDPQLGLEHVVDNDDQLESLVKVAACVRVFTEREAVETKYLISGCMQLLREQSLVTPLGRMKGKQFDSLFRANSLGKWLRERAGFGMFEHPSSWASSLLGGREVSHPLKWVLLWVLLGHQTPLGECLTRLRQTIDGIGPVWRGDQLVLWEGLPESGSHAIAPRWLYQACSAGVSIKRAAAENGSPVHDIRRWLHLDRDLATAWKAQRLENRRRLAVENLADAATQNSTASRQVLVALKKADAEWLRRHDKSAMNAALADVASASPRQLRLL